MGLLSFIQLRNERYPALTGIRALGAASVFFIHLPFRTGFDFGIDVMALFFVLSGFFIFYLYYESKANRQLKLRQYFVNRFARIYPVYFLLVTIAIVLRHNFNPLFLFKNYTLTHALFNNISDRAIQPSWSITVEECFYFLAPLIMYLVKKTGFFVALLCSALLLVVSLCISTLPVSFLHTPQFIFSVTFFGHFFEFFCGIFLALVVLKKEKEGSVGLGGTKFTIMGSAGIIITIGILLITGTNNSLHPLPFFFMNNFILPIPVAVLYYGLIREKSWLSCFLSLSWMGLLGRTSYAFYLVHVMIIESLALPFIADHFPGHYNFFVLVTFLLVQLIACCIFIFYELPLNRIIRDRFSVKKKR